MQSSAQHYFRLTGILAGWTDAGVIGALISLEYHNPRRPAPSPLSLPCMRWVNPNWASQTEECLGIV
jgi:hypothetical protein